MINPNNPQLSVMQQCDLLGIPRSTFYYESARDDSYNHLLMSKIDEEYTRRPFYGVRRIRWHLRKIGHNVGHRRVRRLMRQMDLTAIYPKPRLSAPNKEHRIFPYLLRGLNIDHANQVWSTDITYIRLRHGFIYLVAIMDWFSRYVISWDVSTTLELDSSLRCLEDALKQSKPEIFNSDQGSQFTSLPFTQRLKDAEIKISMDGRGRAFDNIFIERLWRTVKYEEVYLHDYESVNAAKDSLNKYFDFYNYERPHQSLEDKTPWEIYSSVIAKTDESSQTNQLVIRVGGTPNPDDQRQLFHPQEAMLSLP